ncbi:MAG: PD-(D/E)XK nuclease family protein [Treponema sp.]|nr:PD-(D/E)XK nuclease family protein [Treponema sp.]
MQKIQSLLQEQISNQNAVFVFPTDIACQKWADWVIKNTSIKAVAMERFLAWDKFKGECIRSDISDLRTVPATMRKIFAQCLIAKNAEAPFFKSVIIPKYAKESSAFADWIASILPSLKLWKKLRERQADVFRHGSETLPVTDGLFSSEDEFLHQFYETYKNSDFTDDEDKDFEILYAEYSKFLEENRLFDPAWVEPDFSGDGREYFLMYPEILEDWEQYRHKLEKIKKIHFVSVPESEGEYESYFFENSSLEIKDVALFLREMHEKNGIEWSDMAVNVPNLDNFGSYLDREFALYEIPHTLRYSRPLSSYGAGAIFAQIQDCVENQFSYESLKNLLLNEDVPWLNKAAIENLLLFGRMNNCICTSGEVTYEKGKAVTVWDEAFKNPKNDNGTGLNNDELIKNLYKNLVEILPSLVNAKTFKEIRKAYEVFRETFFDFAEFQNMETSNNVLSRCVSSLNEIVDLEADFPNYTVASPFAFFVSHLSHVQYLSQGESRCVQVYPYRTAATAPYQIQVVLDATQDSLSVADSFKPLDFLNENKRRLFMKMGDLDENLGFADTDPTFGFVVLYQHSALFKAYFTASRHAYNGEYGFGYGKMEKTTETVPERTDIFTEEKNWLQNGEMLHRIFSRQALGLQNWKNLHKKDSVDSGIFEKSEKFTELIRNRLHYLAENRDGHKKKNPLLLNRIEVSQTTLKNYFECPRKWLFKDVLKIKPLDNEAELIDEYILGTVNHKIFEIFFADLCKRKAKLCPSDENSEKLGEEFSAILISSINKAVSAQNLESAFKEFFGESYEKNTASRTTIKVISSQYRIDDENCAQNNPNFRMLEKSLAHFCDVFRGCTVHAVEKEMQALPTDENGVGQGGYYFDGKIDCILAMPNESSFIIVDFKTNGIPVNLMVKEKEAGKAEKVIDFQMPMYLYLLGHAVNEGERLHVESAAFYSIKKCEEKFFLGAAPDGTKASKIDTNLVAAEFLKYAKRFCDEVNDEKFAVNALNQSRMLCAAKGQYANCIDYQAVCRRYFTVSGER